VEENLNLNLNFELIELEGWRPTQSLSPEHMTDAKSKTWWGINKEEEWKRRGRFPSQVECELNFKLKFNNHYVM
jgi:hypothetical protein